MSETNGASLRLDKWLWFARLARTRSLAAKHCAEGRVSLGARALKPGHPVRVGDCLTFVNGRMQRRLVVLALGARRGPASEARGLYDEPDPPIPVASGEAAWTPLLDEEYPA
ncbi:MAG TPA: RNA-binding S4 domain-containing protein [Stellaceae bacterium]|nr:RNA-binding S4 domain-containing protein [Stellaceae bacterium]